ncbi:MAG: hypothetical protein KAU31_15820 [Spirochaetaceae bacterium]|nr:hypothetical protein [Spirochaetaceae bacterium]
MLTIFVLPYQQDGSEKKHTSPKAKDQRRVNDRRPDATRRENVEPAADPPADKASKKDPRDDQES